MVKARKIVHKVLTPERTVPAQAASVLAFQDELFIRNPAPYASQVAAPSPEQVSTTATPREDPKRSN